jgi:predicted MPP superfamily phosphohydrolase
MCFFSGVVVAWVVVGAPVTARGAPRWIRLSWTDDTSTTLTVTWTDDSDGTGQAEIRQGSQTPVAVNATTLDTGDSELDVTYEATFTGLTPDSSYEYRVQSGGSWTDWIATRTAPVPGACTPFRFVAVGDGRGESVLGYYVQSQQWPGVMSYIAQEDPLLVIHSGDYVREGDDAEQWAIELDDLPIITERAPFFLALGNHDDGPGEGQGAHFNKLFAQPQNNPQNVEDYYSFVVGNVLFIALNTENFDMDEQIMWMETVLAAHQDAVDWRIVFFHRPIWSSGAHGSNEEDVPRASAMVPVLENYGVDLVLNGHDHDYERFHPSKGGYTQPREINPLPHDNGTRGEADGVIYIVTGGAGALVNPIFDVTEEGSAYGDNHIHYLVVDVDGDTLSLTARDLGSQGLGDPQMQGDLDGIVLEKPAVVCGSEPDGGSEPDAAPDGGVEPDAAPDGGSEPDAAVAIDAAQQPVDAATGSGEAESGCGCRQVYGHFAPASGSGSLFLLWFLLVLCGGSAAVRLVRRKVR